jgi:hypothetical protein
MIEDLYLQYKQTKRGYQQDKILQKVFGLYENYSNILAYRYQSLFPNHSHDAEDWKLLVQIGIVEGLDKATEVSAVRKSIYYRIKHQLAKEVQLLVAAKQTYFHEVAYDLINYGGNEEGYWIARVDIERAIQKLPEKTRRIVELWMNGYPVLSCAWNEIPTKPCICLEVGLKDAAVYLRLQQGFDTMKKYLRGYEELSYE